MVDINLDIDEFIEWLSNLSTHDIKLCEPLNDKFNTYDTAISLVIILKKYKESRG